RPARPAPIAISAPSGATLATPIASPPGHGVMLGGALAAGFDAAFAAVLEGLGIAMAVAVAVDRSSAPRSTIAQRSLTRRTRAGALSATRLLPSNRNTPVSAAIT